MGDIETKKKTNKDWKEYLLAELEKAIIENDGRKSLSEVFRKFADEHGVTPGNTSYYYYYHLSNKLGNKEYKSAKKEPTLKKESKLKPKELAIGDIVDCKISSIKEYGAFGFTADNRNCLIHISEIEDAYVKDIFEYFTIGQHVKAKLIKIAPDGRLSLSMRALQNTDQGITIEPPKREPVLKEPSKKDNVSYIAVPNNGIDSDTEFGNMIKFIKQYSGGNVSPKALDNLNAMISEHGVFNSTLAMIEVLRDLDISGFITSETRKKLETSERLRRRG